MNNVDVLSRAYPARISAVEALLRASKPRGASADELRRIAEALDEGGARHGWPTTAAFGGLLRIAASMVEWRNARLAAEPDAQRFLDAAKDAYKIWRSEYGKAPEVSALLSASEQIASVSSVDGVGPVCAGLARVPLPIGGFADKSRTSCHARHPDGQEIEPPKPLEPVFAYLLFTVDKEPANDVHFLEPHVMHDLDVEIRVSHWPEGAKELRLFPVSVEPPSSYEFPTFLFERPPGEPPYRWTQRGRAQLKVPQAAQARAYEFRYTAAFDVPPHEPIDVIGQRDLRFKSYDPALASVTGYQEVDKKLEHIRDQLSKARVPPEDIKNALLVLNCLGNLAARSIQDALFKTSTREADFQAQVRDELRRQPHIGAQLEEHPKSSGGIADLSFRGIRIELKYRDKRALSLEDCKPFLAQTAMYAMGSGKRVAILCVLDNSLKPNGPGPFPAPDGIELLPHSTGTASVHVVTVLIQGNLPSPSRLSR